MMKTKRVGTITMAIILIALGVIIFISQISGNSALNIALKLWPLMLILLGIEILWSKYKCEDGEVMIKYDIFSIFLVMIILFTNLGLFVLMEIGVMSVIKDMVLN